MSDTALDDITDEELEEATEEPEEPTFVPSTASLGFECKVFVMRSLLDKAQSVLPSKDIMDVLKNFQVSVEPGKIKIIATDLELSVVSESEMVLSKKPGTAVFPGKRLLDIVKEAEEGDMILDVEEGDAHIAVGRASWDLKLMDGSDYPPIPDIDEVDLYEVDRAKFLDAIKQVRYAAATDTVRPSLMLIDITTDEVDGKTIGKMRASDGVRFQQVTVQDWPEDLEIQIPIGAVNDLVRLLRSTDQNVLQIGESDNHLVFRIAGDTFIANKLTAMFPDVEGLLLKPALGNDQELDVDRQDLLAAIRRVRVTADDQTSAIVLSLDSGKMTVSSKDKYGNHAQEVLDVRWDSPAREIALNHVFLSDMLDMADVKSCSFFLGADTKTRKSPLMLKDDETGLVGILNQIRLDYLD